MNAQTIYDLIIIDNSLTAIEEVRTFLLEVAADFPIGQVERDFWTAVSLYRGDIPGFRACNTEYHDFFHARQTFVTMARLLHGAACAGEVFSPRAAALALTAAVFHDSGYLQEDDDREGTGAKYARSHIERGIALLNRQQKWFDYEEDDLAILEALIRSTDLAVDLQNVPYPSAEIGLLGQLLDAADLMAQMSDRTYLEKLLFLYREFREAGIGDYASEGDLLRKTVGFYQLVEQRLQPVNDRTDRYLRAHYRRRHGLEVNPYQEAIRRQHDYLLEILQASGQEPEIHLRRSGSAGRTREIPPP